MTVVSSQKHLFNGLRYPYFSHIALEKRQVRRKLMQQGLYKIEDQFSTAENLLDISQYLDKEEEKAKAKEERHLPVPEWTLYSFVYVAPENVHELYEKGKFTHYWYSKDNRCLQNFFNNQGWNWRNLHPVDNRNLRMVKISYLENVIVNRNNIWESFEDKEVKQYLKQSSRLLTQSMIEEDGVEFRQQEANIERARRAICVLC